MAATRLIALHINKGKTLSQSLLGRVDYAGNPEKTDNGHYVSSYECDPLTVHEEFMLTKREYQQTVGRYQKNDIIAYQIRQSFKPGEITPEKANQLGYELGMRFTKGKHAFVVDTHIDQAHIHNHIIFNSTTLDATRKFKNFWFSGLALQRLSDLICLENGLPVIEVKPYRDRTKRTEFPKKETFRSILCNEIDKILNVNPKDFEAFLVLLEKAGYEIKRGKYIAVRGKGQKRFIRFRSLNEGYTEEDIKSIINSSDKKVQSKDKLNLLIDIQEKIINKGAGYERWATNYNLKQMSKTLLFLRDNDIQSIEDLEEKVTSSVDAFNNLSTEIKSKESRMAEIAVLRKHIINYSKTRDVYVEYRKAGYSKKFFEAHREEITVHKAAKQAFDDLGIKKIPKVKELNEEYYRLLTEKKEISKVYYDKRTAMQEMLKAQRNVKKFIENEQKSNEKDKDSNREK